MFWNQKLGTVLEIKEIEMEKEIEGNMTKRCKNLDSTGTKTQIVYIVYIYIYICILWLAASHLILPVLMSGLWIRNLSLKPVAEPIYCLVAWQVNSVGNARKFLQMSHFLLHFSIEQLFSFIVLGNKNGDMSSFKFLFCLYVTLTVFSGKFWSISWLLCNTGKCF